MLNGITEEMVRAGTQDASHFRLVRRIGLRAYMIVPLMARGRTLGAITFVSAESGRQFADRDLGLAQNLAAHAANAVDNARLYRDARLRQEEIRRLNAALERKVAERTSQLEDSRARDRANLQRLKDMISSMPLAAVAADEELRILHANERFCRIFELEDPRGVIGKNGLEILEKAKHVFAHPNLYAGALTAILQRRQPVVNQELHLKNGSILSCDYIPIFDARVRRGHLLLYRDITREKRVDRAKSEFMSLASHQLRTPLTVIRWALGRLGKTMADPTITQSRMLEAAKGASETMTDTINSMLMISRIEAEKIELKQEEVPLRLLLEALQRECASEYLAKEQSFPVVCPDGLGLRTDLRLIREILINLLRNAIKYTPRGGSVSLVALPEEGGIRLEVRDSGFGIPRREQHKVFRKFFCAQNAIEKDPNGTGLGLYLASIAATLLKAELSFQSKENLGTTFTVRFSSTPTA